MRLRLTAQRQREPDDGVLDGDVRRQERHRDETGDRCRVDDAAAALLGHDRVRRLHAVDHTPQVDVDDPIPVRDPELEIVAADGDPGVVEDQVETAVCGDCVVDQRLHGRGVPDVDLGGAREGAQVAGYTLGRGAVDVGDDDRVAAIDECAAQRGPDA